MNLVLEIKLNSDTLIGSGESYGAIVDGDVVFDSYGLPYIPAKRVKGCLRDSVEELIFLFQKADRLHYEKTIFPNISIESCFGQRYETDYKKKENENGEPIEFRNNQSVLHYENLILQGQSDIINMLQGIREKKYSSLFSKETVLSKYTTIRRQTSIDADTGSAKSNSLRTMRVLKKGLVFRGNLDLPNKKMVYTLALAVSNLSGLLAIAVWEILPLV